MMRQYRELKRRYPDYLLLFRLGDFYEMFLDDAHLGSRLLQIALTSRQKGDGAIPMAGIPHHAADSYITKLLAAGQKVAVCEQMEAGLAPLAQGDQARAPTNLVRSECTRNETGRFP